MTKPIHISFDTETWGKRAGFDARSIGACVFNINENIVGDGGVEPPQGITYISNEFYMALDNRLLGSYSDDHYTPQDLDKLDYRTGATRRYALLRDPETVDWWYRQSPEAQNAFSDRMDLRSGLEIFSQWLADLGVNPKDEHCARIWGHGAAFDPPIVEAWFHAVGLPVPWHYRAPRDTRTAFDFVGIDNHSEWLANNNKGIRHHALDDAITQAHGICEAWSIARQHIPHLQG